MAVLNKGGSRNSLLLSIRNQKAILRKKMSLMRVEKAKRKGRKSLAVKKKSSTLPQKNFLKDRTEVKE